MRNAQIFNKVQGVRSFYPFLHQRNVIIQRKECTKIDRYPRSKSIITTFIFQLRKFNSIVRS